MSGEPRDNTITAKSVPTSVKMQVPRPLLILRPHWRIIVAVTWPLISLPLLVSSGTTEARCGYVVLLMAVYWVTEVVPLAVTALMPVALFPLLGVMSTDEVCMQYLKDTSMLAMAGLMASTAIEHCNLHRRIALKVLLMVGTSPRLLMLGFMLNTMFLSMWISNTASSAMMVPIVQAVLKEMKENETRMILEGKADDDNNESRRDSTQQSTETSVVAMETIEDKHVHKELTDKQKELLALAEKKHYNDSLRYFLGIAYSANIGGTGTIIGSGTNLVCLEVFNTVFPDGTGLNFTSWMAFNVPVMLVNTFIAWIWLQILYMGLLSRGCRAPEFGDNSAAVRTMISARYKELGAMTWHQFSVLVLFVSLITLWVFREPEFIPGWATLYPNTEVSDATPAVLVVLLMFMVPANLDFLKTNVEDRKPSPSLLTWKVVHQKVPWGVVILLGGGFALAEATQVSGLSTWMGEQLEVFEAVPPPVTVGVICLVSSFLTEVSSNSAVANILLPVLAEMSKAVRVHPIYLMMPATVCCSFSFMLPMATPPNAIVADASKMKTKEMIKAGFGLNMLTVLVLLIMLNTLGIVIYNLGEFPEWAEPNENFDVFNQTNMAAIL